MRYVKTLLFIAASDLFSLFFGFSLAGLPYMPIKIASAVCTALILVCLLGSLALKTADEDLKNQRLSGKKSGLASPLGMAVTASAPSLISWGVLFASVSGSFDFYRWHKLINGWFLQVYNFINSDATSAALTTGQILLMLPLALAPAIIFMTAYLLGFKGVISAEKK